MVGHEDAAVPAHLRKHADSSCQVASTAVASHHQASGVPQEATGIVCCPLQASPGIRHGHVIAYTSTVGWGCPGGIVCTVHMAGTRWQRRARSLAWSWEMQGIS